jgi:putative RNA 2'-phosphotransferase
MSSDPYKRESKFLSYLLRHHPEAIDLQLDKHGWAAVEELIRKADGEGYDLSRSILRAIIQESGKQRFILSNDEKYIRATYGHSIDVDLQLHPKRPPQVLYHGTARRHLAAIRNEGLRPGSRNFVHLSAKKKEARQIGARHGTPVILDIQSHRMHQDGYDFYQSEREVGIWLVKSVPPTFFNLD